MTRPVARIKGSAGMDGKETQQHAQTRRTFCARACQAVSIAAFGSILQGCSSGGGNPSSPGSFQSLPVIAAADTNGAVVVTIDSSSALSAVGAAALLQSPAALVLVAHTGQDTFTAFSATCTHAACTITGFGSGVFVCPCHGSEFADTNGRVIGGPAPAPLTEYHTQFANNVLTITA